MDNINNRFEGIQFPQYRMYKNKKSCFCILSSGELIEKQVLGNKILIFEKKAAILPDRNFIMDLLVAYNSFAEDCSKADYDNFS